MTCVWLEKSFHRQGMLISFDSLQHRENYHRMRWVRFFNSGSNQFSLFRVISCDFFPEKNHKWKLFGIAIIITKAYKHEKNLNESFFVLWFKWLEREKSKLLQTHSWLPTEANNSLTLFFSSCSRKLERVRTFICFIIYLLADFFVCDLFALFDRCCLERKSTLTR